MRIIIELLLALLVSFGIAGIIILLTAFFWHFSHSCYDINGQNISLSIKGIKLFFKKKK